MRRPIFRFCAIVQIGLMLFTGCHPTQPFFIQRDESLANYLAQSMDIEYADVHAESLPEATDTLVPYGPNHLPTEYVDLTLEDCISMALNNAKILRVVGGYNAQTGSTSATQLSAQPGQLPSIYDPAIAATTSNTQPLTIDSQGTRVASRGAVRANQVGGVEDALAEFDAQFSALFGYNTTDRPRNVGPGNVFNPQLFQAVDSNAQAAISKRHANGTITTARFTTVYSRNNIPPNGLGRFVPSDYTAALEMQINQPLLRGRGTLVNRIPVMLARANEELALHEFEVNVRNLVQNVEHAYWDLYCDYRAFDSASRARNTAQRVYKNANDTLEEGVTGVAAAKNAAGRFYQFQASMEAALYGSRVPGNDPDGVFGSERRLRELLGWGATDGRCIRPSDSPSFARVHFDWNDVVGEALARNVELRRQKWGIKQDELELISARNQVLPQLDAVLTYRWLGVGDTFASDERSGLNFPAAGTSALEGLTGGDYQEIAARLEYTPQAFAKRRAMANISSSTLSLTKTQAELEDKEVALVFLLARAWSDIDSSYALMNSNQKQYQNIQEELEIYNIQLTDGGLQDKASLLDLLLRSEELKARAEVSYFNAVCEYNKAIVNLHTLKGSLLDLNSIQLQEGAWVDKAYWDAEERARERAGGIYFDYGYTRPGVMSNGPVEQGGITSGNISDPSGLYGSPLNQGGLEMGDEIDTPESIDPPESILENRQLEPLLPTQARLNSQSSAVQPASAQRRVSDAQENNFDWGGLGMNSQSKQPQVVRTGARHSLSDSQAPAAPAGRTIRRMPTDSAGQTQPNWGPSSR